MKYWLSLYLLCICAVAKCQNSNVNSLESRSYHIPKQFTQSTTDLANYIQDHYTGSYEKIRVAYNWVTNNIEYDKDSMLAINWSKETNEKIAATLRRKKGVCDNFASVFSDVLVKMNIPSFAVTGLSKINGRVAEQAHSWSAVKLNNEWLLCDPTWDAGGSFNFFLVKPEEFIDAHWPFDPLWQLLPGSLSLKEFERGTAIGNKENAYNFPDSVQAFLALNPLKQLEDAERRMRAGSVEDERIKLWYAYNNMNIAIIYGEQDMDLYNAAVSELNEANAYLNKFIVYRNNLFKPEKQDESIKEMLQPISAIIQNAYKKVDKIGIVKENFQYDTAGLKERLKSTEKKLQQQHDFLTRYLATPTAQRQAIFYQ
jgi:hypothetical protein